MRFRPVRLPVHGARLALVAGVAGVCFWHARTACSRPIEVVPTQGSTISTNVNQAEAPRKDFTKMVPGPERSWNFGDSQQGIAPSMMPPPNQNLSPYQKELLDRRRNWVFMTPEELMSGKGAEEMLGIKEYDKYGNEKEPMTAMERYYEHLLEPDRSLATNQIDQTDSDPWNKETNSLTGERQTEDKEAHPFESPFNSSQTPEVFRPMRPASFSDVFGTRGDNPADDPDGTRAQHEQEQHMNSFKQLWDMGQPGGAAPASASAFGNSVPAPSAFPSAQPVMGTATPALSRSTTSGGTAAQSAAAPLHATPPRPNFTMPQRPF